jgi:hypothetical protein
MPRAHRTSGSWKIGGVAVGTVALLTASTAAYACLPDSGSTTAAPRTFTVTSVAAFDDHVGTADGEHELSELAELVALVRAKVAAFGSPSTLTPRQAWKIKHAIAFLDFLQTKLDNLQTSDTAKADLQASLAALRSRLQSVLANATVVAPTTVKADSLSRLRPSFRDFDRFGTRHFCDHDGARSWWRFHHHDGDRR